MDPIIEALYRQLPEFQASASLREARQEINAELSAAAGPTLAENLWSIFDATLEEGLEEAFQRGLRTSALLFVAMLA